MADRAIIGLIPAREPVWAILVPADSRATGAREPWRRRVLAWAAVRDDGPGGVRQAVVGVILTPLGPMWADVQGCMVMYAQEGDPVLDGVEAPQDAADVLKGLLQQRDVALLEGGGAGRL